MILRERGEEALGEQRSGFEFVAADGKREDGDVNGARTETVQKDGRDFFHNTQKGLRKFARERSKTRREEVGSYRGNDANGDEAADGVLALDDVAFGGFQLAENGAGARQKCFADVGKPYRAAQAVEETRAELAFEFHDLLGEGWLRDVRLLGGAAKAAGFGDGAKVAKLMQLHRLCLSILSELYIGCIGRARLTLQLRSQAARFARLRPSN